MTCPIWEEDPLSDAEISRWERGYQLNSPEGSSTPSPPSDIWVREGGPVEEPSQHKNFFANKTVKFRKVARAAKSRVVATALKIAKLRHFAVAEKNAESLSSTEINSEKGLAEQNISSRCFSRATEINFSRPVSENFSVKGTVPEMLCNQHLARVGGLTASFHACLPPLLPRKSGSR